MVIGTISNDVKRLIIFRMPENRMLVVNILFLLFLIYLEMMLIFKFFIYSYQQSNQLQFDFCLACFQIYDLCYTLFCASCKMDIATTSICFVFSSLYSISLLFAYFIYNAKLLNLFCLSKDIFHFIPLLVEKCNEWKKNKMK